MRILHTSDWHLGKNLERISRLDEQAAFIDELCQIVESERVQLVLIAGDVFDTANPPAAAEELFCEALERLGDGGRRAVIVIAGNHDSPDRLGAVWPLAGAHGVSITGVPSETPGFRCARTGAKSQEPLTKPVVRLVAGGPCWMELGVPDCEHTAVVVVLPYPSESRLNQILTADPDDEEALQRSYSERVGSLFHELERRYRSDTVRLAVSHLYVAGGQESDSERPIQLGGAYTVYPNAFPASAQYVALGHLHRPQQVKAAGVPVWYSGSPLAYSFSEVGYAKSVVILDVQPDTPASIRQIPLSSGRPLVRWKAKGGLAEIRKWCEEGRDRTAFVDLELYLNESLSPQEIQDLRRLHPGFVNIRPIFPQDNSEMQPESRSGLPVDELFRRFYANQRGGMEPDEKLVELFLEVLGSTDETEVSDDDQEGVASA